MNNDYEEENDKILKAIRALRKDNPLRLQAEMVLTDPTTAVDDIRPILGALTSRWIRKRSKIAAAAWIVSNADVSGEQRKIISEDLCDSLRYNMSRSNGGFGLYWVYPLYVAVVLELYVVYRLGVCSALFCLGYAVYLLATFANSKYGFGSKLMQSRLTLEVLGKLGQPASLGTIATAIKHAAVRDAASSALAKVTANLGPEHYGILPGDTVPALCQAIAKADVQSTLVILTALTYIGDGRAFKTVERLAQNPPNREIGIAASQLLPILRQRMIENNAPIQLLRAGTRPHNEEHHLLRAASGANTDDPDILLRATGVESD